MRLLSVMVLYPAALLPLPQDSTSETGRSAFSHLAEALTSRSRARGIEVRYRMFSVPDLPKLCAEAHRAARLEVPNASVVLRVNQWFHLDRLVIMALDRSGRPVRRVPIAIEVEEDASQLLDLRSDMIAGARVLPLRVGKLRFRVRIICSATTPPVFIHATVQ